MTLFNLLIKSKSKQELATANLLGTIMIANDTSITFLDNNVIVHVTQDNVECADSTLYRLYTLAMCQKCIYRSL